MRHEYLSIIGGNAYYRTPVPLELSGTPAVWFNRNEHQEQLLNFDFALPGQEPRVAIRDNFWTVPPTNVADLECPPSGRQIKVAFENGECFRQRSPNSTAPPYSALSIRGQPAGPAT
jgi:hypothetical protein